MKPVRWVRQFLGLDLPERIHSMPCTLPLVRAARKPVLNEAWQIEKRRRGDADDETLLSILLKQVRLLNRVRLRPAARLAFTEDIARLMIQPAGNVILRFSSEGGLPDSEQRVQWLDTVSELCTALGLSYRAMVQHYQGLSRFRYARQLKNLDLVSFRMMELAYMEQSARALRYQRLEGQTWEGLHTLACILHQAQRFDTVQKPLLQVPHFSGRQSHFFLCSRDLYTAIHTVERLNMLHWPVLWQKLLRASLYQRVWRPVLGTREEAAAARLTNRIVCGDHQAVRRVASQEQDGLYLIWDQLQQRIVSDLAEVVRHPVQADTSRLSAHLSLLGSSDRLAAAELQYQCFTQYDEHPAEPPLRQRQLKELRIFIGMEQIYPLLRHIESGGAIRAIGERLADRLAQHSAVFSDDQSAHHESQWFLLQQTAETLLLSTLETTYTTAMQIGDLAAVMLDKQDWQRPALACIRRIERRANGQATIQFQLLSSEIKPVTVEAQTDQHSPSARSNSFAALMGIHQTTRQLILPSGYRLQPGTRLRIGLHQQQAEAELGHIVQAGKTFAVTALRQWQAPAQAVSQEKVLKTSAL